MRIGNSVGCPPFRYTNRPRPSVRKLNRKARKLGFANHKAFAEWITALKGIEKVETPNEA